MSKTLHDTPRGINRTSGHRGELMYKYVRALALSLLIHSIPAHAIVIEGVEVADTISFADGKTKLLLNGAGLREKLYIDVYIGALYVPAKTVDASTILSDDGPCSVRMYILYKEISKQKLTDGWTDGLVANLSKDELRSIQPRLDAFNKLFTPVHKGDVLSIEYTPEKGTEVRVNGEWHGAVEGNDFFRALLKIWLGPNPVSKSLKQDMLNSN
jgi:hypothetical protein